MEFIKLEQFKGLEEDIQKVFLNWWKPKRYDLYIDSNDLSQVECLDYIKENDEGVLFKSMRDNTSFLEDMIPLLTEGQLRKFIEDKTECTNLEIISKTSLGLYHMECYKNLYSCSFEREFKDLGDNKLSAYWIVAIEIAKEEV